MQNLTKRKQKKTRFCWKINYKVKHQKKYFLNFLLFISIFNERLFFRLSNYYLFIILNPGSNNEHLYRETNFHERFRINVWLGILRTNILYAFFNDDRLNSEMNLHFIPHEFDGYLGELPLNIRHDITYFQQDGAPPHNAANSKGKFIHTIDNKLDWKQ